VRRIRSVRLASVLLAFFTAAPVAIAQADGWFATGSMNTARRLATATRLADGRVLVPGGAASSGFEPTSELYDPLTGTWATGSARPGPMVEERLSATAVLLTDGRVLIAGGNDAGTVIKSVELYDPATNTWATGAGKPPPMATAREEATATLLPNGKVLVAGGYSTSMAPVTVEKSSELYDPATNSWSSAGDMVESRASDTATLLPSGKVLVAGGYAGSFARKSDELYDPSTNTWATGAAKPPDMSVVRSDPAATVLADGRVLIAGGFQGAGDTASVDIYDPASNSFVSGAGKPPDLPTPSDSDTASVLRNGKVLLSGGQNSPATYLYDPAANSWTTGPNMSVKRIGASIATLCDGGVLAAGGSNGAIGPFDTAEVFHPDIALPASGNLLVNGDAEASAPASADVGMAAPLGWTTSGNFTVAAYGASDVFPSAGTATQAGGGARFFAGGPSTAASNACQTVDLSSRAADIDAGRQAATLSADLGGLGASPDDASVTATFLNSAGAALGTLTTGPGTPADRGSTVGLAHRSAGAPVPAGTRAVQVVITTARTDGTYDNGYADNVSLDVAAAPLPLPLPLPLTLPAVAPRLTSLKIAPTSFPAASSGASVSAKKKTTARKRRTGATVSYTDSLAGTTAFTVLHAVSGRRVKGKCVRATHANRKARHCTRYVKVAGFTRTDVKGANHFHFTGRISRRHKLAVGAYHLQAIPRSRARKTGKAVTRSFHVVR
jgi:N-acetylneuraminic acid mutarotase